MFSIYLEGSASLAASKAHADRSFDRNVANSLTFTKVAEGIDQWRDKTARP
jgi:hypothetical protein